MTERPQRPAMPPAAGVDSEPVKWPIAPDGYIPNSVIRSLMRRKRGERLHPTNGCDKIFISFSPPDGRSADEEENVTSEVVCSNEHEDDEEIEFEVKTRGVVLGGLGDDKAEGRGQRRQQERKVKEEKRNASDTEIKTDGEGKEKMNERKEKEEDVRETVVVQEQSHGLKPPKERLDSTISEEKPARDLATELKSRAEPSEQSRPEPPAEQKGTVESTETIRPPHRSVALPKKRSVIPKGVQQPPIRRPVVTVSPKQERKVISNIPKRAPVSSPQDPRAQSEPAQSPQSPAKLISTKEREQLNEMKDVNVDTKAILDILRKSRAYRKHLADLQQIPTAAARHPASREPRSVSCDVPLGLHLIGGLQGPKVPKASQHSFVTANRRRTTKYGWLQTDSGGQGRASDRGGPPTSSAPRSSSQTPHHTWIPPISTHYSPTQSLQTLPPIKFRRCHAMTGNRARSIGVAADEATAASLLRGGPLTHTRVVHRVQMDGAPKAAPWSFSHVIPKPSLHGFVTANRRGTTRYGRLQFEWLRGECGEDELLTQGAGQLKAGLAELWVKTST